MFTGENAKLKTLELIKGERSFRIYWRSEVNLGFVWQLFFEGKTNLKKKYLKQVKLLQS